MTQYLFVLLTSLCVPFLLSFYPPLRFYRKPGALVAAIAAPLVIFGAWDVFAVWRGHWYFSSEAVFPARILNLPVEEALFFVVIPFCCIFTWEALLFFKKKVRP